MLTRLKVSGFKNLVNVDIRFGAFNCIAGANGAGKSNLFDAIRFLSALAQMSLTEAALSIREGSGKQSDIRNLFHRVGDSYVDKMSFEVEMIIPEEGISNIGQKVSAIDTHLKYSLDLVYKSANLSGRLDILNEELTSCARDNLYLNTPPKNKIYNQFIYTDILENKRYISISNYNWIDGQRDFPNVVIEAEQTNCTALNLFANVPMTGEYDTQFLARQEMLSWQLLQLEASALRKPNEFTAPSKLSVKGSNLAASFYHLVEKDDQQEEHSKQKIKEIALEDTISPKASLYSQGLPAWCAEQDPLGRITAHKAKAYTQASNRLAKLIDDVDEVWVDRDDKRELLTLMVKDKYGTVYPARSLSDGTLRFLALTILELDPESPRLLCLEEPENGIHPDRIPKILKLLQDIAVDLEEPIDLKNPLRQVIINTYSPIVMQQVPEDSLLIAGLEENMVDGQRFKQACFKYLANTWRDVDSTKDDKNQQISRDELHSFLNPICGQIGKNKVVDKDSL